METTLRNQGRAIGPAMRWSLAAGAGMIIAGVLAVASPVGGLSVAISVFGWTLLSAGAIELAHAWEIRRERHAPWAMLSGALYAGAGFLVLFRPFEGPLDVGLTIAGLLVLRGLVLAAVAYQLRRTRVVPLFALEALVSLFLGIIALAGWPSRELVHVAFCAGAGLIVNGIHRLAVAAVLRSQYTPKEHPPVGGFPAAHA